MLDGHLLPPPPTCNANYFAFHSAYIALHLMEINSEQLSIGSSVASHEFRYSTARPAAANETNASYLYLNVERNNNRTTTTWRVLRSSEG